MNHYSGEILTLKTANRYIIEPMARTSKRARKNSPLHLPGAFELFTPSKELVLNNIWTFGPLYAVPLIFSIHSWIWAPLASAPHHWWYHSSSFNWGSAGSALPVYPTMLVIGFSLLWLVIIMAAGTIVQIMSQAAQLRAAEGEPLSFEVLWPYVKELGWRMLGLYILSGLAIVFTLFIFARRYLLAPYVMLERKTGITESMRISSELSAKNPGSVWSVIGVIVLIALVGAVPFLGGLASFVLGSLYSVAPALRYQQLKKLT
jgi:uncharacterized membrane protein